MKLPLRYSNCKTQLTTDADSYNESSKYDAKTILVLFLTVFLITGSFVYILYQAQEHRINTHSKSNKFKNLIESILEEANELVRNDYVAVEVQVLDKNHNLIWFKPIDMVTLKNEDQVKMEIEEVENEILRSSSINRRPRSVGASRTREYVVSHQSQFVNCNRFKPIPRGKYLVPPSLYALHKCYEYGVSMEELDRGILRREQGGELRYNLSDLYVACHDVFNSQMDELTSELKVDYDRCKWSGALDESQQRIVEEQFAPHFDPSNAPENLVMSSMSYPTETPEAITSTTASNRAPIDPRAFVECSHVETELLEDSLESPSLEALQRCRDYGVTYDELHHGISRNSHYEETKVDVGNFYLSCQDVFDGKLDYLTNELKEDYRRCKRMRVLSRETQMKVEEKFFEALYDQRDVTIKRGGDRPTTSSSATSTEIVTTTSEQQQATTTVGTNEVVPSPTDCKRVENNDFYICVKVIKSFAKAAY